MPDEPESDFQERVKQRLVEDFGEANVNEEVVLPATNRRADLHVETPSDAPDFVIETEDDWGGVQRSHGQSILYAEQLNARAFIAVPAGHVVWPEAFYFHDSPVCLIPFPDDG